MNWRTVFCCVALLPICCFRTDAQDNADSNKDFVLTKPYVVIRAAKPMEWTVQPDSGAAGSTQIGNVDPEKKPSPKITTIKTPQYTLRREFREDGSVWDTWCIGSSQVLLWPDHKQWIVCHPLNNPNLPNADYVDYSRTDFPELVWIDKSNFVGVDQFKGVDCLKYKASIRLLADDVMPIELTAYINKETRYPVALIRPEGTFTYKFDDFVPANEIPAIVKKLVAQLAIENRFGRTAPVP